MAGVYGGIQSASISSGGPKLPDHFHGIVEIVSESVKNGFHGVTHIAEMVVHESNHHEAPVGFRPSWTANFKQPNTLGNVMCHLGACFGMDPKNEAALRQAISEQVAEYCVSDKQPVRGKFVEVTTEEIDTKGGNKFLLHRWSPTTKTFPSRINDAPVGAPQAAAPAMPQVPTMPGAFQVPQGFAPQGIPQGFPQLPGMPQPSAPALPGAPMTAGFAPALPGFPPMQGAPALPGFPPMQGAPMLPGVQAPTSGPVPPPFAPPPPMALPPLPMNPPAPAFPPPGWAKHPDPAAAAAGWYYLQSDPRQMKTEADLRAGR